MRFVPSAVFAACVAATVLAQPAVARVAEPTTVRTVAISLDDAADAVPYVEEIRAALIALGAPTINEMDALDNAPLADYFDDSARYVAVPTATMNEVTINVGAYNVEDGTDERQEFQAAYAALQEWARQRGIQHSFVPTTAENGFGANEGFDGALVLQQGGQDKNLMVVRLARFGKTIVYVSTDTDLKASPASQTETEVLATINAIIGKLVADKAR